MNNKVICVADWRVYCFKRYEYYAALFMVTDRLKQNRNKTEKNIHAIEINKDHCLKPLTNNCIQMKCFPYWRSQSVNSKNYSKLQ